MQLGRWAAAFLFTQAIETPIYAFALRRRFRHPAVRIGAGFGASTLTHPIVWFVIPHFVAHPRFAYLAVAETFAVVVEAIYLYTLGLRRATMWSLISNGASVAASIVTRLLFHFP